MQTRYEVFFSTYARLYADNFDLEFGSGTWSQRGTKVNGSHHGGSPLLKPTGIQIATKSYATLQVMAPTNVKTVRQTSLLHIESNLDLEFGSWCVCVCVFSSHSFWTSSPLDVPAGVTQEEGHTGFLIHLLSAVCVCVFSSHSFWTSIDVPAGVTQEEGNTGFSIHLLSAVLALIFLARRIQPLHGLLFGRMINYLFWFPWHTESVRM